MYGHLLISHLFWEKILAAAPYKGKQTDECIKFGRREGAQCLACLLFQRSVEFTEQVEAGLGDIAEHLTTIVRRTFTTHKLLAFQLVKQPRYSRRLLDHAIGNIQCRKPSWASAPQNTQHVVLLICNVMLFKDMHAKPPYICRCS
jgi:hypothetical protein